MNLRAVLLYFALSYNLVQAVPSGNRNQRIEPRDGPDDNQTTNIYSGVSSMPSDTNFTSISGKWSVNQPQIPLGRNATQAFAYSTWVGIGQAHSILQTGVDAYVYPNGTYRYRPWYQFFPSKSVYVDSFLVEARDVLSAVCSIETTTQCTLENLTKGTKLESGPLDPPPNTTVDTTPAEWIIESLYIGPEFHRYDYLADFGNLTLTDCYAQTSDGRTIDSSQGITYAIAGDHKLTNVTNNSPGIVREVYVNK